MPDWFPPPTGQTLDGEFAVDEPDSPPPEVAAEPPPPPVAKRDPAELLKLAEVEKELRTTRKTVLTYIKDGKLRAHKVNAYWRVRRGDLDKFMAGETE